MMTKIIKTVAKILLWTAGIWLGILILMQVVLSPSVLTTVVNRYSEKLLDADAGFGKASVSMFRRFPRVSLTLEDFTITYPADRFDDIRKAGAQGWMMKHGCGESADTLACFDKFSASLNALSLLTGTIRIPELELTGPRIFAHRYADGRANWDIFKSPVAPGNPALDEGDIQVKSAAGGNAAEEGAAMKLSVGKISMSGRPHIVYTDSRDTIFAMIDLRYMAMKGEIDAADLSRCGLDMQIDSMFIAGRLPGDTLALGVDRFRIEDMGTGMDISMKARSFLATGAFGRMQIPIEFRTGLSLMEASVPTARISGFKAEIADIPINADLTIRMDNDALDIDGSFGVTKCMIGDLIDIDTDASFSMTGRCRGRYDAGKGLYPETDIRISIPQSRAAGVGLSADIGINDMLGKDPLLDIGCRISADLDSLVRFLPDSSGIKASGAIEASLEGKARMSQLNMYNFSTSSLTGHVCGDEVQFESAKDTVSATVKGLDIILGPETRVSRRDSTRSFRLMGVTGKVGEVGFSYGKDLELTGESLEISARNSAEEAIDTSKVNRLSGRFKAGRLTLRDASGMVLTLRDTDNSFHMMPKRSNKAVPVLSFRSRNKNVILRDKVSRVHLADASISAKAAMNSIERRQKMKAYKDSLAKVYPEVPEDSLFAHVWSLRRKAGRKTMEIPEWMQEEDFRKQDISLRLDESIARYFREWDLDGKAGIKSGVILTPYFPMMNLLRGFQGSFNNDKVAIDSIRVRSGNSDIFATGSVNGLRRALLGRGGVKVNLDVNSDRLNANELLKAYASGSRYKPSDDGNDVKHTSDDEYMEHITASTAAETASSPSLIVIPANINADIDIKASDLKYSTLNIDSFSSRIVMKERCVQLTNTIATSNMGDISLDAFYATRSKKDIKAGASLDFKDITAEKVISLMPVVDTVMPLLKSFNGLLNCEFAVTADLDTNMNIILPSLNGVARISGEDLTINGNEDYRKLAGLLLLKNRDEGKIEKMKVEGVIKDSRLEIFPFIVNFDRFTIGMSGIQNLDQSFRYHASLIRSPLFFKVGLDVRGKDFGNMKFKLGKAKYKDDKVPAFTAVIDQTRLSLVNSIRNIFEKGVDAAVKENTGHKAIAEHKRKLGYVNAAEQEIEALSEEEQKQLDAEKEAINNNTYEQSGIHRGIDTDNSIQ